jgi:hypothetical protein
VGFFDTFAERLSESIQHKAIDNALDYTEKFRYIMPKKEGTKPAPFSFEYYPWLKPMHLSDAELNIGQKAAQMGYTELLLNWIFFKIDIMQESCLYVLPTDDNASDFSAARFDPAIESSPHLEKLFSNTKNTGHKRSGMASLYIRGSRAKNKLISIPVGNIAIDELDQMVQKHIALIWERMSGQFKKQAWAISTPTVEGYGINKLYVHSSEEEFNFHCPHCSRYITLGHDNLEVCGENQDDLEYKRSRLFCLKCKHTLSHTEKPIYLADGIFPGEGDVRGFGINQCYSCTITPAELALSFLRGQEDEEYAREYWNSKMGKPFVPASYRLNDSDIVEATKNFTLQKGYSGTKFISMGIDVGTLLNYVILEWTLRTDFENIEECDNRVIGCGAVEHFDALETAYKDFGVHYAVIDANPERRSAISFCKTYAGRARACLYGKEKLDRDITLSIKAPTVSVNRATWLGHTITKIKNGSTLLPADLPVDFKNHLKANVKISHYDSNGNIIYKFDNLGQPDHYHHSYLYAELAARCAFEGGAYKDIKERV